LLIHRQISSHTPDEGASIEFRTENFLGYAFGISVHSFVPKTFRNYWSLLAYSHFSIVKEHFVHLQSTILKSSIVCGAGRDRTGDLGAFGATLSQRFITILQRTFSHFNRQYSIVNRLWSWSGSNRRPPGCKPGALPAELQPLIESSSIGLPLKISPTATLALQAPRSPS
jgi:hypothetical protein